MRNNELIVKHNSLIRSRYDYTLAELRLILTVASMIEADDEDFRAYSVPAREYSELMGDKEAKNTYRVLQELGEMLLKKPLKIPTDTGFAVCNWFSWYEYKEREGRIECSFHPNLKPYMLQLKEMFTKYSLENILRFKSAYSIRIYELAKSWETRGEFSISLGEFKEIIGATKKYSAYYDFKRYVIERSLKEINALSDITLQYKEKKVGRKITDLVFTVTPNLPKEKNYLVNLRAFISYMRNHHIGDVLYDGPAKTDSGQMKRVSLSISPSGRLYNTLTGDDFTKDKSQKLWEWMYDLAKRGKLPILKQKEMFS